MDIKHLHPLSKILIILIVGAILSSATFFISVLGAPLEQSWGRHLVGNFSTLSSFLINVGSGVVGLLGMLLVSLRLFRRDPPKTKQEEEFSILKRALSDDETLLLEHVKSAPDGVTQDSLRFRLNWSKPKLSTMLSHLDRMGLVQRERFGKTYKVYYQEQKPD